MSLYAPMMPSCSKDQVYKFQKDKERSPARSSPVAAAVVISSYPYNGLCSHWSRLSPKPPSSVLGEESQEDMYLLLHTKSQ